MVFDGELRGGAKRWEAALVSRLGGGVQTEGAARYAGEFRCARRVRPRDADHEDARSEEGVSDEELEVGIDQLDEALKSRVGGRKRRDGDGDGCSGEESVPAGADLAGRSHCEDSKVGMPVAQSARGQRAGEAPLSEARRAWPRAASCDLDGALAAARKSRNKENTMADRATSEESRGKVESQEGATSAQVAERLRKLEFRKEKETGRRVVNARQHDVVRQVAQRVMQELDGEAAGGANVGESLRWCVRGGPGTGKSRVLRALRKELFEDLLKWTIGVHCQITAFQAVMAQLLGGDTMHHARGIPAVKRGDEKGEDVKLQCGTAKRVLQWRWLFIGEISMVSARLLAEVDEKLRGVIRGVGTQKRGADGVPRSFGGLNLALSGDFWKLSPADGGFLADVPAERIAAARKYTSLPPVLRGQALLWGGREDGAQGVTELEECERRDDSWFKSAQGEFRRGGR